MASRIGDYDREMGLGFVNPYSRAARRILLKEIYAASSKMDRIKGKSYSQAIL